MDIKAGTIIGKQYEILGTINRGGMAQILRVRSLVDDKPYALKVATFSGKEDPDHHPHNLAIEKEAHLLQKLQHERIVKIYALGTLPGKSSPYFSARLRGLRGSPWYFRMEYLQGGDLASYVKKCGPLSVAEAVNIVGNIGLALAYLHGKNISHNDIKPENIVFRRRIVPGEPYDPVLVDFGTAAGVQKFVDEAGSWFIMSPERIRMAKGIDPPEKRMLIDPRKSDIWSLSIVLYYALSKHLPFDSLKKRKLTTLILNKEPDPLHKAPQKLDEFIRFRGLAKNPKERPDIREFLNFIYPFTEKRTPATSIKADYYGKEK